jgi:adenylate cyclase
MVGDYEGEIELADRAVALNPNLPPAWNAKGWVHRNAGLPEEAFQSFERAIRMSPVDPFPVIGMGYRHLGKRSEGINERTVRRA